MMFSKELCKLSGIEKRTVLYNYSMLASYSIVFTANSSLQKRAMLNKKSVSIVTTTAH